MHASLDAAVPLLAVYGLLKADAPDLVQHFTSERQTRQTAAQSVQLPNAMTTLTMIIMGAETLTAGIPDAAALQTTQNPEAAAAM